MRTLRITELADEIKDLRTIIASQDAEIAEWKSLFTTNIMHVQMDVLKAQCSRYREALESIASKHRPRHEKEEYWLAIDHASCTTVLATDTKIARNALKEPQEDTKDG